MFAKCSLILNEKSLPSNLKNLSMQRSRFSLLYEFDEFYVLSRDMDFDFIIDFVLTDERFAGKRIKRIENLSEANFHKN